MGTKKYEQSYDYKYYWESCNNLNNFVSYYQQLNAIIKTKPRAVLEIGVGNKLVSNQLKSLHIPCFTVDINKNLNPSAVRDIRNLDMKGCAFDTVCAFEVIEHIPFEHFQKCLIELKKATRKYVIISLPIKDVGIKFYLKLPKIKPIYFYLDIPIRLKQKEITDDKTAHYWEINKVGYDKKKILDIISRHFEIVEHGRMYMNPRHYMLVLKKKGDKK